ncbi:hypothetical protein [Paenibacillus roseipurpureus]|uniref:Uncharacterized protein n=1 Tax=Paenibacillus roseopurpureus TaxID=2918901 RepID=A0AA96LPI9_9BACL|nr:hypothetical protein [Paenibacillus sp. MBLB1832]WNR42535.1 hypothetical protein MJB10_15535 [Paenibacillus sp. MBLB1832]
MSHSKAQKIRQRLVREGKLDPTIQRLHWFGTNPVTKITPTLAEKQAKKLHKHKSRNLTHGYGDDSFCYFMPREA